MGEHISPFAPTTLQPLTPIAGVRLATCRTGMRYKNRDDLLLVALAEGTTVAGVFTKNSMPGIPVDWCKSILPHGKARALVVNAGFSNVFTGDAGRKIVQETVEATAQLFGCSKDEVYLSSTGIIGMPFDVDYITRNLAPLKSHLTDTAWEQAAKAIVTTDTFPKMVTKIATIDGVPVTINGFAKGSGMIAPDMATMLVYIFTDAAITAPVLQGLAHNATENSFNCITVDSDTSTSDTLLLFATQKANHAPITSMDDPKLRDFAGKLQELMMELAQQVVKDGEGISKFITVKVKGAETKASAKRIGLAIANSPLVKTAIAGEDANWGRIVMAIGKSGEKANRDKVRIQIGDAVIAKDGGLNPAYVEGPTAAYMKGKYIDITVDVGVGLGEATVWTCDLTHEYIAINADYRS